MPQRGHTRKRAKRARAVEQFVRSWDRFYLSVTPERCDLPGGGRLPGVLQLEARKRAGL